MYTVELSDNEFEILRHLAHYDGRAQCLTGQSDNALLVTGTEVEFRHCHEFYDQDDRDKVYDPAKVKLSYARFVALWERGFIEQTEAGGGLTHWYKITRAGRAILTLAKKMPPKPRPKKK